MTGPAHSDRPRVIDAHVHIIPETALGSRSEPLKSKHFLPKSEHRQNYQRGDLHCAASGCKWRSPRLMCIL